ncbi:MAG: hypothetical protein IT374_20255 [Polyangiaceae bacterium]|nr:hypothetical protein [Polyangiaceae bacterium]
MRTVPVGLLVGVLAAVGCGSGSEESPPANAGSGGGAAGTGQGGTAGMGQAGDGQGGAGQAGVGQGGAAQGGSAQGGAGQAGAGQGGGPGESVTLRSQPCEKNPQQASKCESYEVACEGLEPAVVDIAYYDAKGAKKGTILFGSGGDGTGYYNLNESTALQDAGYAVVDRRWPKGWFTGAKDGPQQAACRLASVLRMLRTTVAAKGALCATGNSGGSAENVYAWTWQGAGQSLDFALPTSGPFHRLDLACQGQSDAAWVTECEALMAQRCPDCASSSCQLAGARGLLDISFDNQTRCTQPGPGDLQLLKQRSPTQGPFVAKLGKLPIKFLVGKDDPGAYAPLATALVDDLLAAGAKVEISYVTGAPHEMDQTPEGASAIRDALLAGCKTP